LPGSLMGVSIPGLVFAYSLYLSDLESENVPVRGEFWVYVYIVRYLGQRRSDY